VKSFFIVITSIIGLLTRFPQVRQFFVAQYDRRAPEPVSRVQLNRRYGAAQVRTKQLRSRMSKNNK
jgi:hypothetical protein